MVACRGFLKREWLIILLVSLTACGTLKIGIEDPEQGGSGAERDSPPVEVLVAREIALNHIRTIYGEAAPPESLSWSPILVAPEGLVGARSYRFEAMGWTMKIAFPIVAPDATIYTIEIFNSTSGFRWMGQVDAQGGVTEMVEPAEGLQVVAWPGQVRALSDGAGADDYFVILPEGAGAVGIAAEDADLTAIISQNYGSEADLLHVWGMLECGVDDFNGCRILVDRIRQGAMISDPQKIEAWEGVLYASPLPPGSGGDDYFALLGHFAIQYGIGSQDESILAKLEDLRDTQMVVRIWGELTAGIPDWNGTQIRVERLEIVEQPSGAIPPAPAPRETDLGWITYVNQRYGYLLRYPPGAEIEEIGVQGYPIDDQGLPLGGLPEGVALENYLHYLEETYGNTLCVGIKYSLGYIYISAAENAEARYATCGRTGVGVAEIVPKEEELRIDGMTIVASGMEVIGEGESLDAHNETMIARLPDGTRIEYGASPHFDATYQDYLMKTRDVLLQIVQSFEFTE